MKNDTLGNRMKAYEDVYRIKLTCRMPLIVRLDGKSFHSLTARCNRPADKELQDLLHHVTDSLLNEIDGARFAYRQSDEISLLLVDYNKLDTQAWFDRNLQKMTSVTASLATAIFAKKRESTIIPGLKDEPALFDARCFVLPKEEVVNYFIWRQQDAIRNSVQSYGQAYFGPKALLGMNNAQVRAKLLEKGIDWEKESKYDTRGSVVYRDGQRKVSDLEIPIFAENRDYIQRHVDRVEEQ